MVVQEMVLQESRDTVEEQLVSLSVSEVVDSLLSSGNSKLSLCEEEEEKEKEDDGNAEPSTPEHPGTLPLPRRSWQAVSFLWGPPRSLAQGSLLAGWAQKLHLPQKERGHCYLCLGSKSFCKGIAPRILVRKFPCAPPSHCTHPCPQTLPLFPSPSPSPSPSPPRWSHISMYLLRSSRFLLNSWASSSTPSIFGCSGHLQRGKGQH